MARPTAFALRLRLLPRRSLVYSFYRTFVRRDNQWMTEMHGKHNAGLPTTIELAQRNLDTVLDAGAVVSLATIPLLTADVVHAIAGSGSIQMVATDRGMYLIAWQPGTPPTFKVFALHNTGRCLPL
jgi:hypothetical protein